MYPAGQGAAPLRASAGPLRGEPIAGYSVPRVQGVLYAARELVTARGEGAAARLVFHYVKLLGLIYALERSSGGYRLRLDGPLSIFGGTRKYGLRLAKRSEEHTSELQSRQSRMPSSA